MKFMDPRLNVPYIGMDEQGKSTREFLVMNYKGLVDRRRIKRMVRKVVLSGLKRRIHTRELRDVSNTKRIQHDGVYRSW